MIKKVKCICNQCKFVDDCGYYDETMNPIIMGTKAIRYEDEFSQEIKKLLRKFKCECFHTKIEE